MIEQQRENKSSEPLAAPNNLAPASTRERVLSAAYDLFRLNGTRAVGVDLIVKKSGVAKMTLYRHFPSKEDLVAAFLERRENTWTLDWLKTSVYERAEDPAERLLAIFDVFSEWFNSNDFDGCSFINVLLEYPNGHPTNQAATGYLSNIRSLLEELAAECGIADPARFAASWHIMMKGSIIAAGEGDRSAAAEIKKVAELFLASEMGKKS